MNHLEQHKTEAIKAVRSLCEHCLRGETHDCPVSRLIRGIEDIHGIPVVVNDRLHHVMFL